MKKMAFMRRPSNRGPKAGKNTAHFVRELLPNAAILYRTVKMKKGDFLKVSYTGWCEGSLIETNDEAVARKEKVYEKEKKYKPAIVIVGEGMVLPGLDKALEGMKVGEEKKLKLAAKEAFGERRAEMIQLVPIKEFHKQKINPIPGMVLEISGKPARIQSVSSGRVRVDFNHPLAAKPVEYEIKVEEEAKTEDDKIKYLLGRAFRDDTLKYETSTDGDKKKIVVKVPQEIRANRMYAIMRAVFKVESENYLKIKEVDYDDGTRVKEASGEKKEAAPEKPEKKAEGHAKKEAEKK